MTASLSGQTISTTFSQLLHMGGALTATESVVFSGAGVASAVQLGTLSFRAGNVRIQNNTLSAVNTNGSIMLSPSGTGAVVIPRVDITGGTISGLSLPVPVASGGTGGNTAAAARASLGVSATGADVTYLFRGNNLNDVDNIAVARTNLGLGTLATQNASSVAITGGTISGVTMTGAFTFTSITASTVSATTVTSADGSFGTSLAAGSLAIAANALSATNTNGDVELVPIGGGRVLFHKKAGYAQGVGLGVAVTQATSKTTAVTCNAVSGDITMAAGNLAAEATATFQVNNDQVLATDMVLVCQVDSGTPGAYLVAVDRVRAGSFDVSVTNVKAGASTLDEQVKIRFMVIHGTNT
jgi:hypothetical protein